MTRNHKGWAESEPDVAGSEEMDPIRHVVCIILLCTYPLSLIANDLRVMAAGGQNGEAAFFIISGWKFSLGYLTDVSPFAEPPFSWTCFIGWLPNPLFLIGWCLYALGRFRWAAILGLIATVVGSIWGVVLIYDTLAWVPADAKFQDCARSVLNEIRYRLGYGYCLWLVTLVMLTVESYLADIGAFNAVNSVISFIGRKSSFGVRKP